MDDVVLICDHSIRDERKKIFNNICVVCRAGFEMIADIEHAA